MTTEILVKCAQQLSENINTELDKIFEGIDTVVMEHRLLTEYEFDGEDDDDEGMRLMKKLTDYYYLKSPKIFDRLWDERNGKWNHEAKEVIFNLDD